MADDSWDNNKEPGDFPAAVQQVRDFVAQRAAFLAQELGCGG